MQFLSDLTLQEMSSVLDAAERYRAKQLFKWVSLGAKYSQMTNLPLLLRNRLAEQFSDTAISVVKQLSGGDRSTKMLYQLFDGNIIEGIYMPHSYANTLCVSTQVGCRMGCKFCASTIGGLHRNLSAGEIYGQVIAANSIFKPQNSSRGVDNIVLMGSGEPLDNYDNTVKFIGLVTDQNGLNISQRNISLSTCGIPDRMRALADDGFSVNLSISLHATDDDTRMALMPIARKYSLAQTLDACRYYFDKTGRRITIEYTMIKGVNTTIFDARRLKSLLKNMSVHVNLIPLNPVKESDFTPCTPLQADSFLQKLKAEGISASIRKSSGTRVYGACGQLRSKYVDKNKHKI